MACHSTLIFASSSFVRSACAVDPVGWLVLPCDCWPKTKHPSIKAAHAQTKLFRISSLQSGFPAAQAVGLRVSFGKKPRGKFATAKHCESYRARPRTSKPLLTNTHAQQSWLVWTHLLKSHDFLQSHLESTSTSMMTPS